MSMTLDGTAGITFPSGSGTQAAQSKVLQVVNATYSTSTSSSTNTLVATGLTGTITPIFSTSKILILINHSQCSKSAASAANDMAMNIYKNGSNLVQFGTDLGYTNTAILNYFAVSYAYLDSPATTSATTYATYFCSNNSNAASVTVQVSNMPSTITLMEIAA